MPTYSYRCTECEHAFEIHQSFTDDALTTCPECAGTLRKLFTGVGVVFKGSGFYRTDSRAGKSSADTAASTNGSSSTSSESTSSTSASGSSTSSAAKAPAATTS